MSDTTRNRRLLAIFTIIVLPLLALVKYDYDTRSTQRALSRIRSLGGTVTRDTVGTTVYPYVNLANTETTDVDVALICHLHICYELDLRNTLVTDAAIDTIITSDLPIAYVDLRGTSVTESAVRRLANAHCEVRSNFTGLWHSNTH